MKAHSWVRSTCLILAAMSLVTCEPVREEGIPGVEIVRPPYEIRALAIQGELLWAGGRDGVFGIDRAAGTLVSLLEADPPFRNVRALLPFGDEGLWIAHQGGLTRWDGGSFRTWTDGEGLPDSRATALHQGRRGRLWVGTWSGLAVMENGLLRTSELTQGLLDPMVNVILEDDRGGLWFGSTSAPRGGISVRTPDRWLYFTTKERLPHNSITCLTQDAEGAVWAGAGFHDRGGAARFVRSGDEWVLDDVLSTREGLAGEKVRSIFQDTHGVYWFGSEYDGVLRWDNDRRRILTEADGLSSNEVKVFLEDDRGDLWLGTRSGVTVIRSSAREDLATR